MMEFYAAYWDHHDVMDFTEAVLRHAARTATGSANLVYAGKPVELDRPFLRLSVCESLVVHAGLSTDEVVLCNQVRTVDWKAWRAQFIEAVPPELIADVLARVATLIE